MPDWSTDTILDEPGATKAGVDGGVLAETQSAFR